MNKKLHYTLVLSCVCLGSALGLAGTFVLTEAKIEERKQQKIDNALSTVLPAASSFKAVEGHEGVFLGADDQGKEVGCAGTGSFQGYSSKIVVMVGFQSDGDALKIVGLRVIDQQETPGLGANIQKESTAKTLWTVLGLAEESTNIPLSFQDQFRGHAVSALQLVKTPEANKIVAITGATISSTAVVRAVQDAGDKVRQAQSQKKEG